ncbi:hypothetical protein Goari_009899, partial [Gossypium aridum]|nr:hypothetical protein [Gossypium aridum]
CGLILISESSWKVWLACKDKVFVRASTTIDILLFHDKLRSLMWAKVVHEDIHGILMWMNFYVAGVVMEDEAGCGGALSDEKGVACDLFFGLIEATG